MGGRQIRRVLYTGVVFGIGLVLSGCVGAFSTGASMQIDVEVYKGPLSKEPAVQWSELLGIIRHAHLVLKAAEFQLNLSMNQTLGYSDPLLSETELTSNYAYDKYKELLEKSGPKVWQDCWQHHKNEPEKQKLCTRYSAMKESTKEGAKWAGSLSNKAQVCHEELDRLFKTGVELHATDPSVVAARGCFKTVLNAAVAFANELSDSGFVGAYSHVPFATQDPQARTLQVSFAALAAEFGNQISSRADSLLKQMRGEDRRVMPVSIYLRA